MRQQRQQVKLLVGNLEKKRDRAESEEHTGWREGFCLPGFARSLGKESLHFHLQLQRRRKQVLLVDSPACLLLRCLFVCLFVLALSVMETCRFVLSKSCCRSMCLEEG